MLRLPRSPISALLAAVLLAAALAGFAGCGDDASSEAATATTADAPTIVVTTTVLGSLVTELVGDRADVQVLMPNGVDPHDFQPSAKDASRLQDADLIVMNGLELEESLEKPIEAAGDAGVPVFVAGDHVDVRVFGEGELPEEEHADEKHADEKHSDEKHADEKHADETPAGTEEEHAHEHGAGADDPHIWMDPAQMEKVVAALTPVVQTETGLDVAAAGKDLQGRLAALSTELGERAAAIPAANRKLVTGHESMGYFARAYDFELVGAIIPSLSSQAEPSAGELADLREQITRAKVPAIFTEIGTPTAIAEAIGDETGVRVIEVASHNLPDDGSYLTFMREVMDRVEDGLGS